MSHRDVINDDLEEKTMLLNRKFGLGVRYQPLSIKDLCKDLVFFFVLFAVFGLAGCNWFEDKRVVVKPEPIDIRDRWKALAPFIKRHFKTDMTVKEIAAELAYQEYLLKKNKPWDCLKCHK